MGKKARGTGSPDWCTVQRTGMALNLLLLHPLHCQSSSLRLEAPARTSLSPVRLSQQRAMASSQQQQRQPQRQRPQPEHCRSPGPGRAAAAIVQLLALATAAPLGAGAVKGISDWRSGEITHYVSRWRWARRRRRRWWRWRQQWQQRSRPIT